MKNTEITYRNALDNVVYVHNAVKQTCLWLPIIQQLLQNI